MNPNDHIEDAEFDDFLKGEGDLARQLQGMPQPQPPEALSAAILARAAADMDGDAGPRASANDAVHDAAPAAPPARHYLRRARVPLGLAASVVLALFMVRGLMPQAFAPESRPEAVRAEVKVAVASPAEETISAAAPAPPPPAPKPAPVMRRPAARPAPAADVRIAAAPAESPPVAVGPPAVIDSPSPSATTLARAPVQAMLTAQASKPKALGYSAAPPMVSLRAAPMAEPLAAPLWLARMAEMLKAGQTKEARAEWLKFRILFPDAEVPPELQRQLDAIN